jgi:aminoglycoside phosphotransferase (APT) family kinase protein
MHEDELDIDDALVRGLLRAQQPQWADLPLHRVVSSGTDNAMFRLGDDMVVRLPRIERAVSALTHEQRWLPVLASHLPLAVPTPLARGDAGDGYPWQWAVYSWLDGDNAFEGPIDDIDDAARDLAAFIRALHTIDTADAPPSGRGRRGAPLAVLDQQTRQAIDAAGGLVDRETVTAAWEAAMGQPTWHRDPVWVHGDIARGNLLVHGGRIRAVIDFGCSGVGDPACDLLVAWDLFDGRSRALFREAVNVDDATWRRGRGWALCTALWALPYYLHTNPVMVAQARHKLAEVLADTL